MILTPDSTASKVFSRWVGPATVIEVKSAHSYLVEINGARKHVHADKLRKYHVCVNEVVCQPSSWSVVNVNVEVKQCAIVYDRDSEFGEISVVEPKSQEQPMLLPSEKIDKDKLAHLTQEQQNEILAILDKYPECFSDFPGFCDVVQHEIYVTDDFKPKRLRAYRVPESLKPEVEKQIQEMLQMGIIKRSKSEMASPIVCVLKGKDGKDGVRLAIDYRYLNNYCLGDAFPIHQVLMTWYRELARHG